MSLFSVFTISGSAMNAESTRMNLAASNIANKNNISGDELSAYHSKKPIFSVDKNGGVVVEKIVESADKVNVMHHPNHPLADKNGNVFGSNVVDEVEMADIVSSSKNYELNAEVLSNIKQLMIKTIQL